MNTIEIIIKNFAFQLPWIFFAKFELLFASHTHAKELIDKSSTYKYRERERREERERER